jgi:hypothetical protein
MRARRATGSSATALTSSLWPPERRSSARRCRDQNSARDSAGFECDAGHTSSGIGAVLVCHFRNFAEKRRPAWRPAMPRNKREVTVVPSVELDQRAREARLQLDRAERLVTPRPAVTHSWLRWPSRRHNGRIHGGAPQKKPEEKTAE